MAAEFKLITPSAVRTPRAAAIAGIVFALLLGTALVLLRQAVPANPADSGMWLTDSPHRNSVGLAMYLVPFAGISFLWFMGAVRDRLGEKEDKFFATLFLGSGFLFVGMLFVLAALAGGLGAVRPALEAHPRARRARRACRRTESRYPERA